MASFTEITEEAKEAFREFHEEIYKSYNSDSLPDKLFGITLMTKEKSICEELVEQSIKKSTILDLFSEKNDKSVPKLLHSETTENGFRKIDENTQFVLPTYRERN